MTCIAFLFCTTAGPESHLAGGGRGRGWWQLSAATALKAWPLGDPFPPLIVYHAQHVCPHTQVKQRLHNGPSVSFQDFDIQKLVPTLCFPKKGRDFQLRKGFTETFEVFFFPPINTVTSRFNPGSPACRKWALNRRPSQDECMERTLEIICCCHLCLESHSVVSREELGFRVSQPCTQSWLGCRLAVTRSKSLHPWASVFSFVIVIEIYFATRHQVYG